MDKRFAVLILAAGASTRLGRPKQLLPYLGTTLVGHAARTAIASGADDVVIVLGAKADAVREKLVGLPIRIAFNSEWGEGMGASIRCGIQALSQDIDCVVIALCDQPHITPDLLRDLAHRQLHTGSPIAASSYDGVIGAPCAFGREMFADLMSLKGDAGARELIRNSPSPIETVAFTGGIVDVDTIDDYKKLAPDPKGVKTSSPGSSTLGSEI